MFTLFEIQKMTSEDINIAHYRDLKSGREFEHFFPNSSCSVTRLATGNTKVALSNMARWSFKNADQCRLIAPELIGNSLEETLNNIHNFLYWHVQYSIDGREQNLKSPACAWASRKEGTDCKSFSIFASAILLNLGIKHYLRRVKQEFIAPNAYTHVYVVIPVDQITGKFNQGHYVIDATLKQNLEIPFIQKDDLKMEPKLPIYGLAAPGSSCSCKNEGHIDLSSFPGYENFALAGPDANTEEGDDNILNTIGDLIPPGLFNDTFGAVFANGFNLSCWNSTFTPSGVAAIVQKVHVPYYTNLLNAANQATSTYDLQTKLNKLVKAVDITHKMYATYLKNGANWQSCSRQAIDIYIDIVEGVKAQTDMMIQNIQSEYNVSITTQTVPAKYTFNKNLHTLGEDFTWSEAQHGNATYRILQFNENIEDSLQTNENSNNGGQVVEDHNGGQSGGKNNQSNAGFGSVMTIALLLGGAYLGYKKLKK